jgi:hypothetical protein
VILRKFVTSYVIVNEKRVKSGTMSFKIFTLIISASRNFAFYIHYTVQEKLIIINVLKLLTFTLFASYSLLKGGTAGNGYRAASRNHSEFLYEVQSLFC